MMVWVLVWSLCCTPQVWRHSFSSAAECVQYTHKLDTGRFRPICWPVELPR
jgi:hypothetical protein